MHVRVGGGNNFDEEIRLLSYHKQSSECAYFLLPVPIDRSSKLLSASSCPPLLVAALRVKDDALDSCPGCCTLWAEDKWPLLELSLRVRFSVGSVELGLLLDATAFLEELPVRDPRHFSASAC